MAFTGTGCEAFLRKYGYEDRKGREDRINFGGIFREGKETRGPASPFARRLRCGIWQAERCHEGNYASGPGRQCGGGMGLYRSYQSLGPQA